MVDENGHGIPVFWIIHSSSKEETLTQSFDAVAKRMGPDFKPSVIIVDDCQAEINAIRGCQWYALPQKYTLQQ